MPDCTSLREIHKLFEYPVAFRVLFDGYIVNYPGPIV